MGSVHDFCPTLGDLKWQVQDKWASIGTRVQEVRHLGGKI